MNRLPARLFASTVIVGLVATVEGCRNSNSGPTEPSGPTFTISGTVTAYRGGPLSGVSVTAFPCNEYWAIRCRGLTDQQGHYNVSEFISASNVGIGAGKDGFVTGWKINLSPQSPTANFVLQPGIPNLNTDGSTFAGTISGDEFMAGDDVLFGGLCMRTACKWTSFNEFSGNDRQVEVRLRWTDPTRQLALYKSNQDPDSILSSFHSADRYGGSSEVVAIVKVNGYFDAMAVAFEQAGGGPPGPSDSQAFELKVRPMP